jgi:radical SAM-linked protein
MTDFRITFSKTGPLVFISHLDLSHTFVRAFKRAGIPLRYSTGFNPHPKLVFALPLSVGMAGECEMCDVGLETDMSISEFEEKLRAVMPPNLDIISVGEPGEKFKHVKSAHYEYRIYSDTAADSVLEFLALPEIVVTKKTKSGEKNVDIKPQIYSYSAENRDGFLYLDLETQAAPDFYLNPDYVVRALCDAAVLPENTPYESKRTRIVI